MTITTTFDTGQEVYLKMDPDQKPCLILAIAYYAHGGIKYQLTDGIIEDWFFEIEISTERDELKALGCQKKD